MNLSQERAKTPALRKSLPVARKLTCFPRKPTLLSKTQKLPTTSAGAALASAEAIATQSVYLPVNPFGNKYRPSRFQKKAKNSRLTLVGDRLQEN